MIYDTDVLEMYHQNFLWFLAEKKVDMAISIGHAYFCTNFVFCEYKSVGELLWFLTSRLVFFLCPGWFTSCKAATNKRRLDFFSILQTR